MNHPQTPFVSGGNLSLVSNGNISGDAHFYSGGQFAIKNLSGGTGNFVSLYDPIIKANNDVEFGNYTGAALKVEATGSIKGGDITINSPDTSGSILASDPDFTTLTTSRALILRAGLPSVTPENFPSSQGFPATNFQTSVSSLGFVTLKALSDIIAGSIDSNSTNGTGGAIALTTNSSITSGNLTTKGNDINLNGNVILNSDVTFDTGSNSSGNINFTSTIDGANNLTLTAGTGNINSSIIGGKTPLTSLNITSAANTTVTGDISTNGNISISSPLTLNNDVTFNAGTGNAIALNGTVNGTHNLKLTTSPGVGDVFLNGAVGNTQPLTSLIIESGDVQLFDNITTANGDINIIGGINLNGNTTFNAGTAKIVFPGQLTAGSNNLTLIADEINPDSSLLGNRIVGTGNLVLQPFTPSQNIVLGGSIDTGTSTLDLTTTDLATLADGFNSITIGGNDSSGAIFINPVTFQDPVTIQSTRGAGSITARAITGIDNASINLLANQNISTDSVTTDGRDINLTSTSGAITSTGTFDSSSSSGSAGNINLQANSNIAVPTIDSILARGGNGNGGNVTLNTNGDITTGNVIAWGKLLGGNINFSSSNGGITSGYLVGGADVTDGSTTLFTTDKGGSITLNARNNISVSPFIGSNGVASGGNVNLSSTNGAISTGSVFVSATNGNGGEIVLTAPGGITPSGNLITKGNNISLNGNVTLDSDATFDTGANNSGNITFTGIVDGGKKLTLTAGTGNISFGGDIGSIINLSGLDISSAAKTTVPGNITTANGDINISSPVTLTGTGSKKFNAGTGAIALNNSLALDSNDLTLTANEMNLPLTSVTGTGKLQLQPFTPSQNITLGGTSDSGTGTLDLTTTDLAAFQNGFSSITIGRNNGSGAIAINPVTFNDPITITSPSGNIAVNGAITATDNASVTLNAPTTINAGITTNNQAINFLNQVLLGNGANVPINAGNASISFGNTIDGDGNLSLAAGTSNINFGGALGSTTPLASLNINAGSTTVPSNITTTGNINFNSPLTLTGFGTQTLKAGGGITASSINAANSSINLLANGNISVQGIGTNSNIEVTSNNGSIKTTGSVSSYSGNSSGNITFKAAGDINLTDGFDTGERLSGVSQAGNISVTSGGKISTGDINAEGSTKSGNIALTAVGDINTGSDTINAASESGQGGNISLISTNGSISNGAGISTSSDLGFNDAGKVTLRASGNISLAGVYAGGKNGAEIEISSSNGGINTISGMTCGSFSSCDIGSSGINGGKITLNAPGNITTGAISSRGTQTGGDISLVSGGKIDSSAIFNGATSVGGIDASGGTKGGNVSLNSADNIRIFNLNAQGGRNGIGGNVNIATNQLFQATSTFKDRNNTTASISTVGGIASGAVTIRHGGNANTAFIVGNAATNGTAGAVTTASNNTIAPTRLLPSNYTQRNIQILTQAPSAPNPEQEAQATISSLPATATSATNTVIDTAFEEIDERVTRQFDQYLVQPSQTSIKTLADARTALSQIQVKTGIKAGIVYVMFAPQAGEINSKDNETLDLVIVTAEGNPIRKQIKGATRAKVLKTAQKFYGEISNPVKASTTSYLASAQQLYQWLIAPQEAELQKQGIQNLSFIMDAGLRTIPIAALHDGKQFLIEKYSVLNATKSQSHGY